MSDSNAPSIFTNLFSNEDIQYLIQLPEVISAKNSLGVSSNNVVYFTIPITETIRNTLQNNLGIDLSKINEIPMRWVVGNTPSHTDIGSSKFKATYLVYINENHGDFVINNESYPITANTAFVFNENIIHETQNTGIVPRLLLGPMNEYAQPVGIIPITYFSNEADALSYTNSLGGSYSYTVGSAGFGVPPFGGYTNWKIASNSTGSSSQSIIYPDGAELNSDGGGYYYMYPAMPCFLEGTQVLSLIDGIEKYVPIETLHSGDIVKTSESGYKKVELIGKSVIANPGNDDRIENRLYKCSHDDYPELTHDLYITGGHSILVDKITDVQKQKTIQNLGRIFVTEKKYRLIACIDERAKPWNSEGTYNIWHLALEHEDAAMNYGIYVNGGLLVESCSIKNIKRTNMDIV